MKITIVPHQSDWKVRFERIKAELNVLLSGLSPVIEHIGSTAVVGLSAKPIIDINVGVKSAEMFDQVVDQMRAASDYIYYEVFNDTFPQRRLFVKLDCDARSNGFATVFKELAEIPHDALNDRRVAHVHVWVFGSPDWERHIALRDYLRADEQVRSEYQQLKLRLSEQEFENGMAYNAAKDPFIKRAERDALEWWQDRP